MNKNPISETERKVLRAEHRARVARCTADLRKLYSDKDKAARIQNESSGLEEEYYSTYPFDTTSPGPNQRPGSAKSEQAQSPSEPQQPIPQND